MMISLKRLLRNHNTFVKNKFDLRFLAESLAYPTIPLEMMCEVFLNVELNVDINAAFVNIELFKLFAEQVQPKQPDEDEKTHVQHILQKYTHHLFDLKYTGDIYMKKALTVNVNSLETCSSLMPTLKLYVISKLLNSILLI